MERRDHGPIRPGVDFHIHTTDSETDASLTAERLVRMAGARKIFQVAVTNHNTIEGADKVLEIARETGTELAVIKGEEIKTSDNIELLAYFINETIPKGLNIEQTLREIYRQGGLVGIPHPFEDRRWGAGERAEEILIKAKEIGFDVVLWEVFNARSAPTNNEKAYTFFEQHRHGDKNHPALLPIVGSDAHSEWEVGNARWLWIPKSETKEELTTNLQRSSYNGTWYQGNDNIWRSRRDRVRNQALVFPRKVIRKLLRR